MKEIFQRKLFWAILVIFLLAVFVYPPFILTVSDITARKWGWIFSPPQLVYSMQLDLKMLLAESIIAILLSIGICLIPRKFWLMLGSVCLVLKTVPTKKVFRLMFMCVSLAILIYPPFIRQAIEDKVEGGKNYKVKEEALKLGEFERKWGFVFLPPIYQVPYEVTPYYKMYTIYDKNSGKFMRSYWPKSRHDVLLDEMLAQSRAIAQDEKIPLTPFQKFRKDYPEYNDLSDYETAEAVHKKYYSNIPFEEFALKKGVDIRDAPKEVRELRKMKIDPTILTVELMVGLSLSILVTLIILFFEY
jgi:hypothetical protein